MIYFLLLPEKISDYSNSIYEVGIVLNFIFFIWFFFYYILQKIYPTNFNKLNLLPVNYHNYGIFLIFIGILIYLIFFYINQINIFDAFYNPLATRFQIISITGGYYFIKISIWSMLNGFFFLLCSNNKESKFQKLILFMIIFLLLFPLGQKYNILLLLFMSFVIISQKKNFSAIYALPIFILLIIINAFLTIYREMNFFGTSNISLILNEIANNYELLIEKSIERFDWFINFCYFIQNKDLMDISFLDSLKNFFLKFFPESLTGINKPHDVNTSITLLKFGNLDYGTYDFTPFAEWYIYFSYPGFIFMPIISSFFFFLIEKKIVNNKNHSIFWYILYFNLFYIHIAFIGFNKIDNVEIIILIAYSFLISLIYNFLKKLT
ncbi:MULTISPECIES: O-antigen polymerase [Thermodesulfovibrio]|uniref:O-antigen polymerase n=1 Tax=Thermodesulfovibrio yellowstonii TaxID=28262 RepID=UPI0012EB3BD9|nr:O-antigen polymerase [Thermodesulfovibrio islandicus]